MSRPDGTQEVFAGLARGFGGSILFALPLLMTMEMWWLGFYLAPTRILLLIAVLFPILSRHDPRSGRLTLRPLGFREP